MVQLSGTEIVHVRKGQATHQDVVQLQDKLPVLFLRWRQSRGCNLFVRQLDRHAEIAGFHILRQIHRCRFSYPNPSRHVAEQQLIRGAIVESAQRDEGQQLRVVLVVFPR